MNKFYTDGEVIWTRISPNFTAYLIKKGLGLHVLYGHFNGTPREADQHLIIPRHYIKWAERAAEHYITVGALPRFVGEEINVPEDTNN